MSTPPVRPPSPTEFSDYITYGNLLGSGSSNPQLAHVIPGFRPLTPEQHHQLMLEQKRAWDAHQKQLALQQQHHQLMLEQNPPSQSESVPETQFETNPTSTKRKHKKKMTENEEKLSKKCVTWTSKEEAWLAQCWIDSSEDSRIGNSQKREAFWSTIGSKFNNNNNGWHRGEDQLSSKWRNVNKACSEFNGAFNECTRNWRSGENDVDVLQRAHEAYRMSVGKRFQSYDAWLILKDKPKWYVPGQGWNNSQAGQSGDGEGSNPRMEILEDDPHERPPGREQAKKKSRASYSSGSRSSRSSKAEDALEAISKHREEKTHISRQAMLNLKKHEDLRTAFTGASILTLNAGAIENPRHKDYLEKLQNLYLDNFEHLVSGPQADPQPQPQQTDVDSDDDV